MKPNAPQVDQIDGYVTVEKAAALLGVVDSRVRQLVRGNELDAVAIQSVILVAVDAIDRYKQAHPEGETHPGRPRKARAKPDETASDTTDETITGDGQEQG